MNRVFLAFVLALSASALFAQVPPPVINGLSPSSGALRGATLVTVTGRNFDAKINCILPCPPAILFGGVEGAILEFTDTRMLVKTPAHTAGFVEVVFRRSDGVTATASFQYLSTLSDLHQQVLLPIFSETIPGAGGSLWETSLLVHNSGPAPAGIAHLQCPADACTAVFPLTLLLAAGQTAINPDFGRRRSFLPPGRLIYITRAEAGQVFLSLRIRDLSRQATSFGTEIPAVREDEFFSRPIVLLDVPVDPRFRRSLRVYETAVQGPVEFDLRVMSLTGGEILLQTTLSTTTTSTEPTLPPDPGYAQILNFLDAPQLAALDRVRVEIWPRRAAARFWAFITVTNNETQQVTTITPQ